MVDVATSAEELSLDDERALLVRLRNGEAAAFERLVRTFGPRMLVAVRRLLVQEQDSQDALQEAFLAAYRSIGGFQGDARLGTWLHRIAINCALMKLRSKRRRPELAIDDLLPRYSEDGHRDTGGILGRVTLDTASESKEIREQVHAAIERLPDPYREIVILRDIEELDTEETARQLEISEGAVKTRLHRARMALRELLQEYVRGIEP